MAIEMKDDFVNSSVSSAEVAITPVNLDSSSYVWKKKRASLDYRKRTFEDVNDQTKRIKLEVENATALCEDAALPCEVAAEPVSASVPEKAYQDDDLPGCSTSGNSSFGRSNKRFRCDLCEFETTEAHRLKRHNQSKHTDDKRFNCQHCSYSCRRKDALKAHNRTHSRRNPLICRHCEHVAIDEADAEHHQMIAHRYFCRECYAVFPTQKMCSNHEREHTTFTCRQCNVLFSSLATIRYHERRVHHHHHHHHHHRRLTN